MKKIYNFLRRDPVNTIVLALSIILVIVYFSRTKDMDKIFLWDQGNFTPFIAIMGLFTIRFMVWHYSLWDKVDKHVKDLNIRRSVFNLPPYRPDLNLPRMLPLFDRIMNMVMLIATVAMLILVLLSLLSG